MYNYIDFRNFQQVYLKIHLGSLDKNCMRLTLSCLKFLVFYIFVKSSTQQEKQLCSRRGIAIL